MKTPRLWRATRPALSRIAAIVQQWRADSMASARRRYGRRYTAQEIAEIRMKAKGRL